MGLPLVECDEDGGFILNEAACDMLRAIDEPVAVVALCGPYRSGKSFLLNRLADQAAKHVSTGGEATETMSGFQVGSTINACTSGIWIHDIPAAKGKPRVLLLDVEGFGSMEKGSDYDSRVFSLATLLCSRLVYNSKGSIEESAIQSLAFVTQVRIERDERERERERGRESSRRIG